MREYLSAHAPEKNEMINRGTYATTLIIDTQTPDEVCNGTNRIIANCTIDEPKSVK